MAYCEHCGSELSPSAVACPKCGHPGPGSRSVSSQIAAAAGGVSAAAGRTDGYAVAALASSIAGVTVVPVIGSILGLVFAHLSLGRLDRDPTLEGRQLANAARIIGWVGVGIGLLFLLFFFAFVGAIVDNDSYIGAILGTDPTF